MVTFKLVLLTLALLALAVFGFAIKLIFKKDAKPLNTSCGAVTPEMEKRGVDACATGGCSTAQIDECKSDGRIKA